MTAAVHNLRAPQLAAVCGARVTDDPRDAYLGLVVAGWVLLFAFPPGAAVVGLFLTNRRPGHGLAMFTLSLLLMAAAVVLGLITFVGA